MKRCQINSVNVPVRETNDAGLEWHGIFIRGTSNPFNVKLDITDKNIRELHLAYYAVKGAPVVASVPTSTVYNLHFHNISDPNSALRRNDNLSGFPLLLTGSYTAQWLTPPQQLCYDQDFTKINSFQLKLSDTDGESAVFDEVVLYFIAK